MLSTKRVVSALLCLSIGIVFAACNPAKNVPKVTVTDTKSTQDAPPVEPKSVDNAAATTPVGGTEQTAAPAVSQTLKFDPYSSIIFLGSNMLGTREGGFSKFDGSIALQGDKIETVQIDITIDMSSVYSDSTVLTDKLKGEKGFFEVDQFPKSTFKSTGVAKSEQGFTVSGNLNLHGIEKGISFPATIAMNGKELTAQAEFVLNRQDFKIVYEGAGDYAVRDDVVVKLDIKAVASAS